MDEKILSKDEMNALLGAGAGTAGAGGEADRAGDRLTVYNFRRPERFPKEALEALRALHDRFCSSAAASLSGFFRTGTAISVVSVDQANYSEFLQSVPDPTLATALSLRPMPGTAVLEMSLEVAYPLVDRLLGGTGASSDLDRNMSGANESAPGRGQRNMSGANESAIARSQRKMTEIERNVIQGVISLLATELKEAWRPVAEISFHPHTSESRPQLLQAASPNEVVLVVAMTFKMADAQGALHLCIPHSALAPVLDVFVERTAEELRKESAEELRRVLVNLLRAPVEITCDLPATMIPVDDVLNLAKGDIVKLDGKIGDGVLVKVAGKPAYYASLIEIDGVKSAGVVGRVAE